MLIMTILIAGNPEMVINTERRKEANLIVGIHQNVNLTAKKKCQRKSLVFFVS